MMFARSSCLVIGRRVGGASFGSSVPRQLAFSSQTRLLSNVGLQRVRPLNGRVVPISSLPGSTRNFWWPSSKPVPTPEKSEATTDVFENSSTDTSLIEDLPPAEAATLVDPANAADVASTVALSTPDVPVDSITSAVTDAVSNLPIPSVPPPPLNYGDFAALGLGGWSPIGICQLGIESLQVFTGMPWFWTIVSATVVSRIVLFPFAVMGLRNAARMAPFQEEFTRLREETMAAQKSGDPLRLQPAVLQQRVIYEKSGVSMAGMFVPTLVQIPVTLGMFLGVKRLCDLPVEQLKYSGLDILPNLTVADPTWILPIITTAAINVQLSLSTRDMAGGNPNTGHIINAFRGLTILGFIFMANLPAGTLVYLLTGVVVMTVQSLFMRNAAVRAFFGIPPIPEKLHAKSYTMLESLKYARDAWNKKRTEAIQEAANRTRRR